MTHGEILVNLYWADLFLRTKRDADNSGRSSTETKMSKLVYYQGTILREPISSREGLSKTLPKLFIDFEKEFLFTYLKKLRPKSKLYAVHHMLSETANAHRSVAKMYANLQALNVPYFVLTTLNPWHQEIIFLNETDSVIGAAALS